MNKVWFIADTHFCHERILKFTNRNIFADNSIEKHDEYIIKLWNSTVDKHDTIYIIGDFALADSIKTRKVLQRLNGNKVLILGNHDKVPEEIKRYFNHVTQIKNMTFKASLYKDFMKEDMHVVMCHFPMVSWDRKNKGYVMVHGHCHGKLDNFNDKSKDLRVDVGFDSKLGNHKFISLEKLYNHFKSITKDKSFVEYGEKITSNNIF